MDRKVNRVAALANISAYDEEGTKSYVDGAPHIKHASLRSMYAGLVVRVFEEAQQHTPVPRVLDLGAGEGSVTLPFLDLGARVTAVDISESQLEVLRTKCAQFGDRLEIRCEDINDTLQRPGEQYDIIVVNSFLHHVPDYVGMLDRAIDRLTPHGQVFSFQDPLRYDSLDRMSLVVSRIAYFSWRIFKGDVLGGIMRQLRRNRGVFVEDSVHDNAEYHVVRNGVDQEALTTLYNRAG